MSKLIHPSTRGRKPNAALRSDPDFGNLDVSSAVLAERHGVTRQAVHHARRSWLGRGGRARNLEANVRAAGFDSASRGLAGFVQVLKLPIALLGGALTIEERDGHFVALNEAGEVVATDDHHGLPEPVKRVSVRVPVSLLGGLSDGAVEVLLVSTLRARQAVRS